MIDFYSPDLKNKMAALDRNKPVYIYCRTGNRSAHASIMLQQLGFKKIVNLKTGITDWQRMGLKLVTG
jgi:thioredoxin 1